MKPPAQILAQFPTSFISCLLHLLSQHARTRVQCKFAIVQKRNFVYAAPRGNLRGYFCLLLLSFAHFGFVLFDMHRHSKQSRPEEREKDLKCHRGFATLREIEAISTWPSEVTPQFLPTLNYTGDPAGRSE